MEIYGFHLKLSCFTPSFLFSHCDDWEIPPVLNVELKLVKSNLTAYLFLHSGGGSDCPEGILGDAVSESYICMGNLTRES